MSYYQVGSQPTIKQAAVPLIGLGVLVTAIIMALPNFGKRR